MENSLRESQLASLGKLMAGYTHELKNHLAIINESSGLMDDLLEMSVGEDEVIRQRLKKIITSIGERIARANTMARYLNRVAHRLDSPVSSFNVSELLEEELALMARFAAMKEIVFKRNFTTGLPSVYGNPALLQFVIFSLVNELIETCDSGTKISFFTGKHDGNIEISIESSKALDKTRDRNGDSNDLMYSHKIINFAVQKMDASFNTTTSADGCGQISLEIPLG